MLPHAISPPPPVSRQLLQKSCMQSRDRENTVCWAVVSHINLNSIAKFQLTVFVSAEQNWYYEMHSRCSVAFLSMNLFLIQGLLRKWMPKQKISLAGKGSMCVCVSVSVWKKQPTFDFANRQTKLSGSSKCLQRNTLPTCLCTKCPGSFGAGSPGSREGRAGSTTLLV